MHVGRDKLLPIGLLLDEDEIIVSPAYTVFEIVNKKELLPEYLMMKISTPEFDRRAWFSTDSSIRGGFSRESLCEITIPIPSFEEQVIILLESLFEQQEKLVTLKNNTIQKII
jgi:type I restriction enzyme S subunit